MNNMSLDKLILALRGEWERLALAAVTLLFIAAALWSFNYVMSAANLRDATSQGGIGMREFYGSNAFDFLSINRDRVNLPRRHAFIVVPDPTWKPPRVAVRPNPNPNPDPNLNQPVGPTTTVDQKDPPVKIEPIKPVEATDPTPVKPVPKEKPLARHIVEFKGMMTTTSGSTEVYVSYERTSGRDADALKEKGFMSLGDTINGYTIDSATDTELILKSESGLMTKVPVGGRKELN